MALFIQLFAGRASADVTFATFGYAGGSLGIVGGVSGDLAVTERVSPDFGGDTVAFARAFADKLLVAARGGLGTSGDRILIYDPSDLSAPLADTSWDGVRGVCAAEYMSGHLYVASQADGRVVRIETENFTKTGEYRFDDSVLPAGYSAKGVALAQLGGRLYALFTVADSSFPPNHQPSRLVKLSGDLTQLAGMQVLENAHTLATHNNQLYAAGWGGARTAGADASKSGLWVINTSVMGESEIFNGADIDGAQIAAACFAPDGSMLIATHRYDAGFNALARLYRIGPGLTADSKQLVKTLDGRATSIAYDRVTGYFWVANASGGEDADQLMAFDRSDGGLLGLVKSFSASDLGGPIRFAASTAGAAPLSASSDAHGDGGCSSGAFGTAGLLSLSLLFAIRRKNG